MSTKLVLKSTGQEVIRIHDRGVKGKKFLPENMNNYLIPYTAQELIHAKVGNTHHLQVIHNSKVEEVKDNG